MAIDISNSNPAFQIEGLSLYAGAGAPTFATATTSALYFNTSGSSTSTRLYVTQDNGTTWIAITTAS